MKTASLTEEQRKDIQRAIVLLQKVLHADNLNALGGGDPTIEGGGGPGSEGSGDEPPPPPPGNGP